MECNKTSSCLCASIQVKGFSEKGMNIIEFLEIYSLRRNASDDPCFFITSSKDPNTE